MDKSSSEAAAILLIDDDTRLCQFITEFFAGSEFSIHAVNDGPRGLARALEGGFDLILLDVMLPGMDGFEILTQLRRRSMAPVIMLTARGAEEDRVAGLNAGADDYLGKPFGPEELAARITAVLRRSRHVSALRPETTSIGPLRLEAATRRVWIGDTSVPVTVTEFDILDLLARAAGRVVSRDEVCGMLYQRPSSPYERTIEVHISRLRRKIEASGIVIRSIRGAGYSLSSEKKP